MDGQEENRPCDGTMKSGCRQAGESHVAIRAQEGEVLNPQLCHLGKQLVEEHPWGDQGKGLFSARPLRRGFLNWSAFGGDKIGGERAARVTGT